MSSRFNIKNQILAGMMLITLCFFLIILFGLIFSDREIVRWILASLGTGFAIYFLCQSTTPVANFLSWFGFLLNFISVFILTYIDIFLVEILIILCIGFCIIFIPLPFISDERVQKKHLTRWFMVILTLQCFVIPCVLKWKLALIVQLFILLLEQWRKEEIFYFLISLFLGASCYFVYSGGDLHEMLLMLLLGSAGAGAVQFLCLTKTEKEQALGVVVYFSSTSLIGILEGSGDKLFGIPQGTLAFWAFSSCVCLGFYLISKIKNETIWSVIFETRGSVRTLLFSVLSLLNIFFFDDLYSNWILSLNVTVVLLGFLKYVLKGKEE